MAGTTNQSIKELVYEGILNDIILGVYPANSILNERTLVEKYGGSKTSVREALVQLCSEGILKNIPRFGYQLPVITPSELSAIIEYRIILETGALKKTLKIITREQIDRLNSHAKHAGALAQKHDITTHWSTNMEFHLMLCECCSNQFMFKALNDALKFCSRGANQYFNKSWETGNPTDANGHVKIVDAIRHHDEKLAEELLIKDIECLWEQILG